MNTNYYYIGETLVEVKSSDILLKCISLFCHQEEINHETVDSFMKYEIIEEDSSERITELSKEYGAENNDGLVFQLLNVRYVYFEKKHLYIARSNFCLGFIDVFNRKVKWYVYLQKFFPRSLFHITILDPYSLLCPQIGEIVVHGALMIERQKSILFLGKSGSGKSTITHRLSKYIGYEKACDDTFVIRIKNGRFVTYPIDTGCGYDFKIAEDYVNTGEYYELYRVKGKAYILRKSKLSFNALVPSLIIFLDRTKTEKDDAKTEIRRLAKKEILKLIIDSQTNIASSFLLLMTSCFVSDLL